MDVENQGKTRKAYYFDPEDFAAMAAVRAHYGLCSDNDALRFAVRMIAEAQAMTIRLDAKKARQHSARIARNRSA